MSQLSALILGASGLVGTNVLHQLLEDERYHRVIIMVRRKLNFKHEKLEQILTDFSNIQQDLESVRVDVMYTCLGTTKKLTPNLDEYRRIEIKIPESVAIQLLKNGLKQIHFVSAIGVNAKSGVDYIKIKYDAEQALKNTGVESMNIYQPSLIAGRRKQTRFLESFLIGLFKVLNIFLVGGAKKYRSVSAHDIASKMIKTSKNPTNGTNYIHFP